MMKLRVRKQLLHALDESGNWYRVRSGSTEVITIENRPIRDRDFSATLQDMDGNWLPCLVKRKPDGDWFVEPHESWVGPAPVVIAVEVP